jgi:hypothetical protein
MRGDYKRYVKPIPFVVSGTSIGAGNSTLDLVPPDDDTLWLILSMAMWHVIGAPRDCGLSFVRGVTSVSVYPMYSLATATRWPLHCPGGGTVPQLIYPMPVTTKGFFRGNWTATAAAEVFYIDGIALEIKGGLMP